MQAKTDFVNTVAKTGKDISFGEIPEEVELQILQKLVEAAQGISRNIQITKPCRPG